PLRSATFARLGCGFLLLSVLISCVLLVFNGLIITNVYAASAATLPEPLRDRRLSQAIVFLGPVLLLVVQWWAFDVTVDWLLPTRRRK
ncbi:MAG TPA: hypothetical protein VFV87_17970, partial [Pirellulaceae bacterium]|nr:hypothetical protein [Pirellulaceae bacterium]